MAASELSPKSAVESHYRSLRDDFEAAYKKMTDLSREFNAILTTVPAELSPEERQARKKRAAEALRLRMKSSWLPSRGCIGS